MHKKREITREDKFEKTDKLRKFKEMDKCTFKPKLNDFQQSDGKSKLFLKCNIE